jgi:hypothetical protein
LLSSVVADTDDLANQRILTLAAEHVPKERLVGVITKCDRAAEPEKIVEIVQNNEGTSGKPLYHGWFVVQNRSQKDDPESFDRDKAERATFSKDPWVRIEEKRRGTVKLKSFLSALLCTRIREGFPRMQKAVEERLENEQRSLDRLGQPRPDVSHQRAYLVDITQRFQTLAGKALRSPEELHFEEMKLRGKAERAKQEFAINLRLHGHFYEFSDASAAEVAAVGKFDQNTMKDRTLYDEIRSQIRQNQGEELQGMINPAVLKPLLRQQASKWPELATEHLENMARLTNDAVLRILKETCKDLGVPEYIQEELERIVVEFAAEARKSALKKLDEVWREEALHLQTDNPAFLKNVREAQETRFFKAMQRYAMKVPTESFMATLFEEPQGLTKCTAVWRDWTIVNTHTLGALFAELHSHTDQNTEDEIHDLLKAYYQVSSTRLVLSLPSSYFIPLQNPRVTIPAVPSHIDSDLALCLLYLICGSSHVTLQFSTLKYVLGCPRRLYIKRQSSHRRAFPLRPCGTSFGLIHRVYHWPPR